MTQWYKSVHHNGESYAQIGIVVFLASFGLVFGLLSLLLFQLLKLEGNEFIYFAISIPSVAFSILASQYMTSVSLYEECFYDHGIKVRTKVFGKVNELDLSYSSLQFIQLYSRESTVRNNPKVVIVVDENSKYELHVKDEKEFDSIAMLAPADLVKKIM